MIQDSEYDAVVIGAGHAGVEAACALAKLGHRTLLVCLNLNRVANMPCNPSIGGSAKGIVVREIDALGGVQGKLADSCALQMKVLNMSRGPGVRSLRAQVDKVDYPKRVLEYLRTVDNLTLMEAEVKDLCTSDDGSISEVILGDGTRISTRAAVLCTGTHMEAVNLRGHTSTPTGPDGEPASHGISAALERLGVELHRLKTGTPPRIRRESIDFSNLEVQRGTPGFWAFSYDTREMPALEDQIDCYLTHTTPRTHEIIREHLQDSAMYGGLVKGIGPRYCPSIEDKIVRFPDHERHLLFVEPESIHTDSIYLQGFSTSMPEEVQVEMVHSLPGFERAEFLRYAYAIEYDAVKPLQLTKSLMLRKVPGLFCAGQIVGTSGYEEAAALGLVAGINASRYLKGQDPFILGRDRAYIGVMIDDLMTKGSDEPYRLMSSRSEYRLLTRSDNADDRLMEIGYELGLNSEERYREHLERREKVDEAIDLLNSTRVGSNQEIRDYIVSLGFDEPDQKKTMAELLQRPKVTYRELQRRIPELPELTDELTQKVEIETRYRGYIQIEEKRIERWRAAEELKLPADVDYSEVQGLSLESREALNRYRPSTIGEASRIVNIHPADLDLLIYLARTSSFRSS